MADIVDTDFAPTILGDPDGTIIDPGDLLADMKGKVDAANALAAESLSSFTSVRDTIYAIEPVTDPATDALGYTGAFGAGIANFTAPAIGYIGTATNTATLDSLSTYVTLVGSGNAELVIMTGSVTAPVVKAKYSLTGVVATGTKTWTTSDFGTIRVLAGEHLFLNLPTGGIRISQASGGVLYYAAPPGALTVGATQAMTTASGQQLEVLASLSRLALKVDAPHTSAALFDRLSALYAGAVAGTAFGWDGEFAADQVWLDNALSYVGTSTVTGSLTQLMTYVGTLGTGALQIVVMSGTLGGGTMTVVSKTSITATATGRQVWTSDDFGSIAISSGQHVFINSPSGGARQAYSFYGTTPQYYAAPPGALTVGGTQAIVSAANRMLRAAFAVV